MKNKLFGFMRTNRKGLALISVLGVVTLATILILALFSVSDAEFKAARNYSDGTMARQLADSAVNMVIGQIQAGATGSGVSGASPSSANRTIWASQPGAIRVYNSGGDFVQGRRLYSSDRMVVNGAGPGGEQTMADDFPASDWSSNPAVWVDLNDPLLRALPNGTMSTVFPIVDPRASITTDGVKPIEGFDYKESVTGKGNIPGVVKSGSPEDLRVPMPVRWLYVLKDGSMGVAQGSSNGIAVWDSSTGTGVPSKDNPIVGRLAFWTDDESCKVNINTAGEPGNYNTPTFFHERENKWASNQPVWREFQRYPGHPATVALSSILFPNPDHSSSVYDCDNYPTYPPSFIQIKDSICKLVPKLSKGSSADGTLAYAPDDFSGSVSADAATINKEFEQASKEHLFASVDEWIFDNLQPSSQKRQLVVTSNPTLISAAGLDRSRFFLTAHSRAPETNMFGMPRVAIWPVPDAGLGTKFRTGYDSTIAYASSLAGKNRDSFNVSTNSYYFSRRDSASALEDIGLGSQAPALIRNSRLMTYLDSLVSSANMPGGGRFATKYGQDSRQILVEIFDYIRITNLYDAFLDEKLYGNDNTGKPGDTKRDFWDDGNASGAIKYNASRPQDLWINRPTEFTYYTYTAPRFNTMRRVGDLGGIVPTQYQKDYKDKKLTTGAYPGHGQVRPIEWNYQGQTYKGLGRFPTISEIGLQFICTGDGKNGNGSYRMATAPNTEVLSGGKAAKRIDPTKDAPNYPRTGFSRRKDANGNPLPEFWYSNIPPFPGRKLFEKWGCDFSQFGQGGPRDPKRHPAADPMNWNCTLDSNVVDGGIELSETEKRIQIVMQLELFVPALGYTKYAPDFTIVLDGKALAGFEVKDVTGAYRSVFNTTSDQVVQSTTPYMGSALGESVNSVNVSPLGGSYGTAPLMSGRQARSMGRMPQDPNYQTSATSDPHSAMQNFPLVSSFFTVDRSKAIEFRAPKQPLKIDIYASHDWQGQKSRKNTTPSQSVFVQFEDGKVPVPWLVVYSTEYWKTIDTSGNLFERKAVHAPRWWSFNNGGALQRYEGQMKVAGGKVDWSGVKEHAFNDQKDHDTRGRFSSTGNTLTRTSDPGNQGGKELDMPSTALIYGYSPLPTYRGVKSNPRTDLANVDYFQDAGVRNDGTLPMGTYGFYGTDSVRSMVPDHGDYRILAARPQVPATTWVKHRVWKERPDDLFAHSLMGASSNLEAGCDIGDDGKTFDSSNNAVVVEKNRMQNAWYPIDKVPDTPLTPEASLLSRNSGDFDNGLGDMRDGAYINKADDGNISVDQFWYGGTTARPINKFYTTRNAYFTSSFLQLPSSGSFFTPNRMVSSPVMFGSLPTGVYGSAGTNTYQRQNGVPWRTLLFRPDPNGLHYGRPATSPADHNFLDLFWMPVVEPYAISDSFSTAGKINLNYQMLPFAHIKRATALHAALKGELMTAVSSADANYPGSNAQPASGTPKPSNANPVVYKKYKDGTVAPPTFWGQGSGDPMEWHRKIDIEETLTQFEERFNFQATGQGILQGLFRTASQICEIHLVPRASPLRATRSEPVTTKMSASGRDAKMKAFWTYNNLTGDNVRERPYANIYQKITTRSNTYRVYFIAQAIRKAKSVSSDTLDLAKDTVTGEYRGSALIDRFLDFSGAERGSAPVPFPDYADGTSPFSKPSLETFYRYRVLEMKQISP